MDQKKKILIVDDDPFMQSLYRKALEREGFTILTAVDGLAAIEMLPNLLADLVVLDLMLPKVHGLKVLEAIRADSHHKNLPVLILSNAYLPDVAQKAMKAQASKSILKSECSPKKLVAIIRDIFNTPVQEDAKQPAAKGSWISNLLGSKNENSGQATTSAKAAEIPETNFADTVTLSEVQNELQKSWPTDVSMIRENCLRYVKCVGSQESDEHLKTIYRRLRLLSARATMGECHKISQLSNALEAMLFEHGFNLKRNMSPSVVQTMVQAVDCLEHLFKAGRMTSTQDARKTKVLLVDDDPVCNMANDLALKRANFDTMCASDGTSALALLENNSFDLIFLDINMPVLSGFEVCEKIRKLPQCKDTPVIFVTLLGDFQSRAQSVLSGSNGFIAKPISPLELIVKALVFLLRAQERDAAKGQSSATKPVMVGTTESNILTNQPSLEGRVNELQATKAAVEERVKNLTDALAAETKRREEAEQKADANAKLQSKLEASQAENKKAQEWLQRLKEESQKETQTGDASQAWKMEGRTRALEAVRNFVEDKVRNLTEVLAVETKRSEEAKLQVAEYAKRRGELETALAAIQQAKENLIKEIEAAGNGKLRGDLEAQLAENQKSQDALLQKMQETMQEFQVQQESQVAEPSNVEARTQELEAARAALAELKSQHAGATEKVQSLTESLAAEAARRAAAEQQATELQARRNELEQELAQRIQAQEQLRAELTAHEQLLEEQLQTHNVEQGNLTGRLKEFEASQNALAELKNQHADVTAKVQTLSESLANESDRRTNAEKQAAELEARRAELEKELEQRSQAQEQLHKELAEQQTRLNTQVETHQGEVGNLSTRLKELEVAQASLAELKNQHAGVTAQVQTLTESLAAESNRRTSAEQQAAELETRRAELEKELEQRSQAQEQLRKELAEQQTRLDAQVETHQGEVGNLSTKLKELDAAQNALAELKTQHSSVTAQVQSLTESLATESDRRTSAEQQTAELQARRVELEKELEQRALAQEKLRKELAEQQVQLNAQVETHQGEVGNLSTRLKELEVAQAALAELKTQHSSVTSQVQSLTESLATESGRRSNAEQQTVELQARRTELEKELAQRSQAQEKLRAELVAHEQLLGEQLQNHTADRDYLVARTQELEAAQNALTELKNQHSSVTAQVQSLTESLATESGRRASAEQQTTELVARRAELEQELALRSKTQEQLSAELIEKQQRLDEQIQAHNAEAGNLAERTKELEAVQTALAELKNQNSNVSAQVQSLTESLAAESGRRTSAEQQTAELKARRAELEHELAQRSKTQEQLHADLAEQQARLDAQVQAHNVERGNLVARAKELEAVQNVLAELKTQYSSVTTQVQSLTESLAAESERRTSAEQQAAELKVRRAELEQEVAQRSLAQEKLQKELAEKQRQLNAQVQVHNVEVGNLAMRTQELEAIQTILAELRTQHSSVTAQVQSLTESLTTESSRRTNAEQQATELKTRRVELEQELAQRSLAQEKLRSELAEKQQRLDAQVQVHNVELGNLAERTKELAAVQNILAELKKQHSNVLTQVQSLTESLAVESGRRTNVEQQAAEFKVRRAELEQEVAQRSQTQEQLRSELAEQQLRLETVSAELEGFRTRAVAEALRQKQMAEQITESENARTELGNELNVVRELSATRAASIHALESELQERRGEHEQLNSLLRAEIINRRELETQIESSESKLKETSGHLAQKYAAEQAWLTRESELQSRVRTQQDDLAKSNATLAEQEIEIKNSRERIEELQVVQSALSVQIQDLTGQAQSLNESLAAESGRRTNAEQQVAELVARRAELESELAQRIQAQAQLREELTKQIELHHVEREKLAARTKELEVALTALAELKAQHASVTESLAAESGRRVAAEQVWLGRELELQGRIRTQRENLAKSDATLSTQESEIKNLRKIIEELQVLQSALCLKVQHLNGRGEVSSRLIQELQQKIAQSELAVEASQKKQAGLRYSILDASRMSARLHRERSQKERHGMDAARQLLSSLAQTPLSLAQRELLTELQSSLDGLKNSRVGTSKIAAYPAELPGLRDSEFSFTDVTENAFHAVRAAAEAAGVTAQVSAYGTTPGKLIGYAEHIYQLITLLAVSPLTIVTGVSALDLRVAIKSKCVRFAELTVRVALSSDDNAQDLLARLTSVTTAAATLQTGLFDEAELGLAAGWQLAQAMGAQTALEVVGGKETCLVLSLPIEMGVELLPTDRVAAYVPTRNSNGINNGNGSGNNNVNRYGNHTGYPLNKSLIANERNGSDS
jgi:DNA-binding response OmpR family regulator